MDSENNEAYRPFVTPVIIWVLFLAPFIAFGLRDPNGIGWIVLACVPLGFLFGGVSGLVIVCYRRSRNPRVVEHRLSGKVRWFGALPPIKILLGAGQCIMLVLSLPAVLLAMLLLRIGKIAGRASSFNVVGQAKLLSAGYRVGKAYTDLVTDYRAKWNRVLGR